MRFAERPCARRPELPGSRSADRVATRGFTFIEILFVMALLSLVGLVIFTTFARGIDLWQRLQKELVDEEAGIAFEKMTHDLRNSFYYSPLLFIGTDSSLRFPTIVRFKEEEEAREGIGQVEYYFDTGSGSLFRRQANMSQAYKERYMEDRPVVTSVSDFRVSYFYFDKDQKDFFWTDTWQQGGLFGGQKPEDLPLAVRVALVIGARDDEREYVRTIYIPQGWWGTWRQELPKN